LLAEPQAKVASFCFKVKAKVAQASDTKLKIRTQLQMQIATGLIPLTRGQYYNTRAKGGTAINKRRIWLLRLP
jgi:hypothetical protein